MLKLIVSYCHGLIVSHSEIFKSMEITRVNIGKQRQEEAESERNKITDIAFSLRIAELDVPLEDEEKLFLMKEYVKLASKNYRY